MEMYRSTKSGFKEGMMATSVERQIERDKIIVEVSEKLKIVLKKLEAIEKALEKKAK